jgi:hypothetical protein
MLCREIPPFYSENHTKHINILYGKNIQYDNIERGDIW